MNTYKQLAAKAAVALITPGQVIGIGDGSTMLLIAQYISMDEQLRDSVVLSSSSAKTAQHIYTLGMACGDLSQQDSLDIYFDGCDGFDRQLNALKSGSGIHTREKIAASMAREFILVGDYEKYMPVLSPSIPLVVEVFPLAIMAVIRSLHDAFPGIRLQVRSSEGERIISGQGNFLLDVYFQEFEHLQRLDQSIKMLAGVANHSLFFQMATRAVIAGPDGVREIYRP